MSIARQARIQSFPLEVREYNPERCCRFYSDFMNSGDFFAVVNTSGQTPTNTFSNEYSITNKTANIVTMSIPSTSTATASTQMRESPSGNNAAINGGVCEMDFMAKVSLSKSTVVNVLCRVGFYDDTSNTAPDSTNALVFFNHGSGTTWNVGVYSNWNGTTGFKFTKDTGIAVSDWNTLSIWQDAKSSKAIFQIGSACVHVQDGNLPVTATQSSQYRAGISMVAAGTTAAETNIKADFMQFRYFTDRST